MATITTLTVRIAGNVGGLKSALSEGQSMVREFGDSVGALGQKMQGMGTALSLSITAPVAGLAGAGIAAVGDFSKTMAQLEVNTGATAAQMEQFEKQALDLGASTVFSAAEVAQAQLELSKAGLDAGQTLAALPGVLDLAAASEMALAEAAAVTATTLNTFGRPAEDAVTVANSLAAAAVASTAEVSDMAYALSQGGTAAANFGLTTEQTLAMLAQMANKGIMGSDAGTSLKTFFSRLSAGGDEATKVLESLNVSLYDSAGAMRDPIVFLEELSQALYGVNAVSVTSSNLTGAQAERMKYLQSQIQSTQTKLANYQSGIAGVAQSEEAKVVSIDRLNRQLAAMQAEYDGLASAGSTTSTVMRELSEEQRNAALQTLFGSDAIRAANILLPSFAEEYQEALAGVERTGIAAALAEAGMAGIAGAIEEFRGAVESTLIEAILPYEDGLATLTRRAADLVSSFTKLSPATQRWIMLAALGAAAIGPLLIGLGTFLTFISAILPGLTMLGTGLTLLISPIGLVVAGLIALFTFDVGGVRTRLLNMFNVLAQRTEVFRTALMGLRTDLVAAFAGFFAGDIDTSQLLDKIKGVVDQLPQIVRDLFESDDFSALREDLVAALGLEDLSLESILTSLQGLGSSIAEAVTGFDYAGAFTTLSGKVAEAIALIDWAELSANAATTWDNLKTGVTDSLAAIDWGSLLTETITLWSSFKANVQASLGAISWAELITNASIAWALFKLSVILSLQQIDWESLKTDALTVWGNFKGQVIASLTSIDWSDLTEQASELWAGFKQTLLELFPGAEELLSADGLTSLQTTVEGIFGPDGPVMQASGIVVGFINSLSEQISSLDAESLASTFNSIVAGVLGITVLIASVGLETTAERVNALIGLGTSITTFITDFAEGIDPSTLATALTDFASNFGSALKTALGDEETLQLGTAIGSFVSTLVTKLGELLSGSFGSDVGEEAGGAVGTLATAAMNLVTGFAAELGKTDWTKFQDNLSTFVTGFLGGFAAGLATADWGTVVSAFLEALGGAILNFGRSNPFAEAQETNMLTGEKFDYPTWSEMGESIKQALGFGAGDTAPEPAWVGTLNTTIQTEPAWVATTNAAIQTAPPWVANTNTYIQTEPDWISSVEQAIQPEPDWVAPLIAAFNVTQAGNGGMGDVELLNPQPSGPNNALGTQYWQGGGTWVGEVGKEWVTLPRGTRIDSHHDSYQASGSSNYGQPLAGTIIVRSEQDIERLVQRNDELRRRRRGGR